MSQTIALENALYLVATPIGCLQDISLRALSVLREVDWIIAEDTRHTQKLLSHYDINKKCYPFHAHNEREACGRVLAHLSQGKKLALVSDAGTPVVSDPGAKLVSACHDQGIKVIPVPGACAAIAAVSCAGLPTTRFVFTGFLPNKTKARRAALLSHDEEERAMVCYESPKRLKSLLEDIVETLGEERIITLARELTKKFETICRKSAVEMLAWVSQNGEQERGEIVIVIAPGSQDNIKKLHAQKIWEVVSPLVSHRTAAQITAKLSGYPKQKIYRWK